MKSESQLWRRMAWGFLLRYLTGWHGSYRRYSFGICHSAAAVTSSNNTYGMLSQMDHRLRLTPEWKRHMEAQIEAGNNATTYLWPPSRGCALKRARLCWRLADESYWMPTLYDEWTAERESVEPCTTNQQQAQPQEK